MSGSGSRKAGALPPVVILEGSDTVGLALARSIRRLGARVYYFCARRGLLGLSRMVRVVRAPRRGAWADAKAYDESLVALGRTLAERWGRKILIFAVDDPSLYVLLRAWPKAERYFAYAGRAAGQPPGALLDKAEILRRLEAGLDPGVREEILPRSLICTDAGDIAGIAGRVGLPCVVKPARGDPRFTFRRALGGKVVVARSLSELREVVARGIVLCGEVLVQEMITEEMGKEVCWWGYRHGDGRLWGVTGRELRKWPRHGGSATHTITERNGGVERYAQAILEALDYRGICELAFMEDGKGRLRFLLDLNGRPWLQVLNALGAGADVARIAYCDHYGLELPAQAEGRSGVEWVRVGTDIAAVISGEVSATSAVRTWLRCAFTGRGSEAIASAADAGCLLKLPVFLAVRAGQWLSEKGSGGPA